MPSAWIVTRNGQTSLGRLAIMFLILAPLGARASGGEPRNGPPCPTAPTCQQSLDIGPPPAGILLAQAASGCVYPTIALHLPMIVAGIVAKHLNVDESEVVTGKPYRALGMDDLDQIEIVMDLESQFDMEIDDDDAVRVTRSFPDTIAYLRSRQCQ